MRIRLLPESSHLGWTPYAYLVYLSFYVVYGVARYSLRDWLIAAPALVAFLVLYFRGFWLRGRPLLLVVLGIVGIGVLLAPRNPGANCFFIYAAAFLGDVGRPTVGARWLLVIVVIVAIESWLLSLPAMMWAPAIVFSLLIGGSQIHFGEVRRKDRALLEAHQAAEHLAKIAERERIARDLHDLLGHTLSIIVLKSELAAKVADRDLARAMTEIRDVERISRNALAEVRQAVYGYRGERLGDELETLRPALAAAGVTLESDIGAVALSPDQERTLALALREAVTNIIRHARAKRCRIALANSGDVLTLTIEDDGVGGDASEGAGLSGMRARLAEVGGTLERDLRHGTCLTLRVPKAAGSGAAALVPS
jgi:two-component system, NarL family, sensor histidine kinase DesK